MEFTVITGDCINVIENQILDASVDVVVTSPPYNNGTKYADYLDDLTDDQYRYFTYRWTDEVRRVIKPNGSFFLNLGSYSKHPTFAFDTLQHVLSSKRWALQNTIHWIKSISIDHENGSQSYGHFKPINSDRYLNNLHEYVFHLTPSGDNQIDRLAIGVPYADKSNVKRWKGTEGKDLRCRGNVWFIPYKTIQSSDKQRPHAATFPVELPRRCIRLHGGLSLTVMDPFVGIGNSLSAARLCESQVTKFVGIDVSEHCINETRKKINSQDS